MTQTEVTLKGAIALFLAGLAFTLNAKLTLRSQNNDLRVAEQSIRTRLEQPNSARAQRSAILRLIIGGILAGLMIAVISSVTLSILVTNFLGRLS